MYRGGQLQYRRFILPKGFRLGANTASSRPFHDLPRRAVMEECAYNATHRPEIQAVFTKVMNEHPKVSVIYHRNGLGELVQGNGEELILKEAVSGSYLAVGRSATAKDVHGWIAQLTPRENRTLEAGIDITFLNELLQAVETLKTEPKLADVCKAMADECHKPAASIDVEVGEFLYGLSDTFNIIKEAHTKHMIAEPANLTTASGRKATHVVGGHPSNFVVYFSPVLEAIALGWPSVILNHPQVPTAASQFIALLAEHGVNFNGKLVQAVVANIDELCNVFAASPKEISQGILIAGLNMGEKISKVAPNTKQELSGSNELVCTVDQYLHAPKAFIDSLKVNLGYSAGKQCTAPSKIIMAGFGHDDVKGIQTSLQTWSDASTSKPARHITDFTSHLPYLFNNDEGNIRQFTASAATEHFTPFVTGPRAMFTLNDPNVVVQEVFGPATAIQFVDSLSDVQLSRHSLSMGINIDIEKDRAALTEFLKARDLKYLPCIINIGYSASTLAATPTGEAFIPWQFTLSGQDTGMGPHSPLRYASFQVAKDCMVSNAASCASDTALVHLCNTAAQSMAMYPDVFGTNGAVDVLSEEIKLLSNAVESDRSLLPTLNARLTDESGDAVKMTLYMPIKIGEPTFIRLSSEDTPAIRRNMVAYAVQLGRQGVHVKISAPVSIVTAEPNLIPAYQECFNTLPFVSIEVMNDDGFVASLAQEPHTVLTSDEELKVRVKRENHFLTVFLSTQHTPYTVVGLKPQTVKVSGSMESCTTTLTDFIHTHANKAPIVITPDHIDSQVTAVNAQIATLRKRLIISQYDKYATPHYKDKVPVIAASTAGIRVTEADGGFYYDCNMAYGAAKAGYTPNVSSYDLPYAQEMGTLPSQAMYTKELALSVTLLSKRYGPLIHQCYNRELKCQWCTGPPCTNPQENGVADSIQVCLLNSGGEIMDSIQQAIRRALGKSAVIIYPRGNFNGRRDHANKLNQKGPLPLAFDSLTGELIIDSLGRCFSEFNDAQELHSIVHACKAIGRRPAIIWEPIQGEGGVHVTSPAYAQMLSDLQASGNLLVVADEVQTGFTAPSASMGMVSAYLGVKPDMLALAKSVTLGRVAASCCILTRSLAQVAFPPGTDGGTFSGSPTACYWLIAADKFWHDSNEGKNSLDTLFELGNTRRSTLEQALSNCPNTHIQEVRGIGSMGAVHFNTPEAGKHYHDLLLHLSDSYIEGKDGAPCLPIGFKGVIQKMSGKSSEVMRITAGLSEGGVDGDQELLTAILCHVLTCPDYYPSEQ